MKKKSIHIASKLTECRTEVHMVAKKQHKIVTKRVNKKTKAVISSSDIITPLLAP